MKASQIKTSAGKQQDAIQPKAKNQAPDTSILQAYQKGIVQRNAFWQVNAQNKVANPVPLAAAPAAPYLERVGNTNQRLYNRPIEAKNAARSATAWSGNGFSTRKPNTPAAGAGYYQYNETVASTTNAQGQTQYMVTNNTPMIVRHDQDAQAILTTSAGAQHTPIKHWHAATSNNSDLLAPQSTNAQPQYNQAGNIEHYLINPL